MKPYFQNEEAGITLYHGDCREILPLLPSTELCLADPPYGIQDKRQVWANGKGRMLLDSFVYGDNEPFDPSIFISFPKSILWGGNHYSEKLPSASQWLVWDKREGSGSDCCADCELAWTNLGGPARLFHHNWRGMIKASENGQRRLHPTQKPIALMEWCISQAGYPETILDPFNGSGTTGVACIRLGRQYTGIEIEERYCEISAKRFEREIAQGKLFDAETLRAAESQTAIPFG